MKLHAIGRCLVLLVLISSSSNRVVAEDESSAGDANALDENLMEAVDYFGINILDPVELAQLVAGFGSCTFCDSGDIVPDQQFAGSPCSEWEQFSLFSKPEECAVLRAAAVDKCGCEMDSVWITPATPKCWLCPDGTLEGVQLDKRLPTMSQQLTCGDISQIPVVEWGKTCEAISGFGYICGCPGTTPQCHLCSDGSAPTRPNAILPTSGFAVGSETEEFFTSKAVDNDAPLKFSLDDPTCASFAEALTMNTKSACPGEIREVEKQTGLFVPAYCGCTSSEEPRPNVGCNVCPPGYKMKNLTDVHSDAFSAPNLPTIQSCQEWITEYAPYMVDKEKCFIAQNDIAPHCCEAMPVTEDGAVPVSLQATSSSRPGSLGFLALFASIALTSTVLR